MQLAAGENAVIEPAPGYRGASVHWVPEPLRGTAFLAGLAAYGLMALARRAAAAANRAQGGKPRLSSGTQDRRHRQCVRVDLDVCG